MCSLFVCNCVVCTASQIHHSAVLSLWLSWFGRSRAPSGFVLFAVAHPRFVVPPSITAKRSQSLVQQHRGSSVRHFDACSHTLSCRGRSPPASPYWRVADNIHVVWRDGRAPVRYSMLGQNELVCSVLCTWPPCTGCSFGAGHICSMVQVWL